MTDLAERVHEALTYQGACSGEIGSLAVRATKMLRMSGDMLTPKQQQALERLARALGLRVAPQTHNPAMDSFRAFYEALYGQPPFKTKVP